MNAYRLAAVTLAAAACAPSTQALEPQPAVQIQLVCPDHSVRTADISLAVAAGHYRATQAQRNRMLEHARSVCAAGLSVVSLIPPDDLSFADDGARLSGTAH